MLLLAVENIIANKSLNSETASESWTGFIKFPKKRHPSKVLIFQKEGRYAAIHAYCPHEGYDLSSCSLQEGNVIECPLHGKIISVFGEEAESLPVILENGQFVIQWVETDSKQ